MMRRACSANSDDQSPDRGVMLGLLGGDSSDRLKGGHVSPVRRRTITLSRFVALAFFLTCGGPFGLEPAVYAGGAGLTLIGLVVLPIVWTVPQALMTAELATMMPENGGQLVWVFRGLGQTLGIVNALNSLCSGLVDKCIYPNVLLAYMPWQPSDVLARIVRAAVLIALSGVNIAGLDVVADFSAFLMVGILTVFLAEVPYAPTGFSWRQWLLLPESIDWGVLFSVLLWASTGWDSVAVIAGEVVDPHRSLPIGIALAVIITTVSYAIPIVVGFALMPDPSLWSDGNGFFLSASRAAPWVGTTIMASAVLANLGLCTAGLAANSQVVCAMARSSPTRCRILPEWLGHVSTRFGTPANALVAQCIIMCFLVQFDLTRLIQLTMLFNCISLLLEFAAFITLRYSEPDTLRPFSVPGGMLGAWAMTLSKGVVVIATLATMLVSSPFVVITGVIINIPFIAIAMHFRPLRKHTREDSQKFIPAL